MPHKRIWSDQDDAKLLDLRDKKNLTFAVIAERFGIAVNALQARYKKLKARQATS